MNEQIPLKGVVALTLAQVSEACREYMVRNGLMPSAQDARERLGARNINVNAYFNWQAYPTDPQAAFVKVLYEHEPRED